MTSPSEELEWVRAGERCARAGPWESGQLCLAVNDTIHLPCGPFMVVRPLTLSPDVTAADLCAERLVRREPAWLEVDDVPI